MLAKGKQAGLTSRRAMLVLLVDFDVTFLNNTRNANLNYIHFGPSLVSKKESFYFKMILTALKDPYSKQD